MAKYDLTAQRLRDLLHYDPITGVFTHREWRGHGRRPGERAGGMHKQSGYRRVSVDAIDYQEHQLVWLYVHGTWATGQIDHINGVRDDNRLCNLRDVPDHVNRQNRTRPRRDNSTGFAGVHMNWGRYAAHIRADGKRYHLGTFDTPQEAHEAFLQAKRRLHEGCTL